MRTVSNLLWPAGTKLKSEASPQPLAIPPGAERSEQSDTAAFADDGARSADDHEVLRKLLTDTSHQLSAIDGLKDTFGKLVEPLNNLLTTLEHEKADTVRSQDAFEAIRGSHETLRAEFQGLERRSFELERDNERLRRELEAARRSGREFEDDRAKLSNEVAAVRIAMSVIVKQLGEETGTARTLSQERGLLAGRADTSDKRAAELETQLAQARERLSMLDSGKSALQAALERSLAESSHSARQLAETESALTGLRSRLQELESSLAVAEAERNTALAESLRVSRQLAEIQSARSDSNSRLQQLEGSLAAAEAERNTALAEASRLSRQLAEIQSARSDSNSRLQQLEDSLAAAEAERDGHAAARAEADERRQKEGLALRLELHELRSRFDTAEEFLADARTVSAARAEDIAAAEARLLEATVARGEAEKEIELLSTASQDWQQQTQKLECEIMNLTDRCKVLSETLASREGSLGHANEKIKALSGQLEQVQSGAIGYRTRAEQAFAQLNATIEHERRERALAEGALVRARNDYARLQRQMVEERSTRRSDHQRRVVGNNSAAS